jgi:GntR family transcriptional regulator
VRISVQKVIRSSERHQIEKDLAVRPEAERGAIGEAETNLNMSINDQEFSAQYDIIDATPDLAEALNIKARDKVLRRHYEAKNRKTDFLLSYSTSYIPLELVSGNPAILDEKNEPWPGGTQHQFLTVGVEVMCVIDEVTARMPTTVEVQMWGLPDGVPLLFCRRVSFDAEGKTVEISDADYPADRTEFRFVTPLKPWPKKRSAAQNTNTKGNEQ